MMKQLWKSLAAVLLAGGIAFSVAACTGGNEPFVPPETGEGGKTTINDAYDWNEDQSGSTRPDLGLGYEPQVPVSEVELTISEKSSVRFKGGSSTYTMKVDETLSADVFEASTLNGRTVAGLGIVNEDGGIRAFQAMADFAPSDDVTIMPYFEPAQGESVIFGSKEVGDYATDGSEDIDGLLSVENALLNDEVAKTVSYDGPMTSGAYFRTLTALEREAGQNYTYYYTVRNDGEEPVQIQLYQMFTGTDFESGKNGVAARSVLLKPGMVARVPISVTQPNDNTNAITMVVIRNEISAMKLTVSMAAENVTPSMPITINVKIPEKYKNTFKLIDYDTTITTNDKLVLPTEKQIKNDTGYKLLYWVDEDGNEVKEGTRYYTDVTISPVFAEPVKVTFKNEQGGVTLTEEYQKYLNNLHFMDSFVLPTEKDYTNKNDTKIIAWQDAEGNRLTSGMTLTGDLTFSPVYQQKIDVSIRLPEGVTLNASGWTKGEGNVYTGQMLEGDGILSQIPEVDTKVEGYKFQGWYIAKEANAKGRGNFTLVDGKTVVLGEIEIAPYYTADVKDLYTAQLWFGNAQNGGHNNSSSNGVEDNAFGTGQSGSVSGDSGSDGLSESSRRMIVNEKGIATFGVGYTADSGTASFAAGGQTRVNTNMAVYGGSKILGGTAYTFTITIENYGSDVEKLEFHYGNSSTTTNQSSVTTADETIELVKTDDKNSGFVVSLKAGEVKTYVLTVVWDAGVSNNNTLFVIKNTGKAVENFSLGVSYFVSYAKEA